MVRVGDVGDDDVPAEGDAIAVWVSERFRSRRV